MMIALGADHGGFTLKEEIKAHLGERGIPCKDYGTHSLDSCDYPDIAAAVCRGILEGECETGILICGTGIGISISANKFPGIRAALCENCFSAKYTRMHNNANILCMGGRVTGAGLALMMVDLFLDTPFAGGRHQKRLEKITALEAQNRIK